MLQLGMSSFLRMNILSAMRSLFITALAFVGIVSANAATFEFGTVHSSAADAPQGAAPWATLEFNQNGVDQVDFTLTHSSSSVAGQFLRNLYLNIDPFVAATVTLTDTTNVNVTSTSVSQNAFGHATATGFDLFFEFQTSGGAGRFAPGESISWTMTGAGLTESNFMALSGGSAPAYGLIHLQGIPGGFSSHIEATPVPEPATMVALAGLAAVAIRRRKK